MIIISLILAVLRIYSHVPINVILRTVNLVAFIMTKNFTLISNVHDGQ